MSGAEAAAVLGLLSSIITIITTAKELYDSANDVHGLPDALRNAETKLPLILMILKEAHSYSQHPDINPDIYDAFERILPRAKRKANELLEILEKVLPKEGASTFDRYRSATRQLMKGSRVEHLMKALFEEILTLTSYFSCPTPMKAAVKEALEEFQRLSLANPANKDHSDGKALREIKYNTDLSYSDLSSKQELEDFLHNWLLPENLPGASFESDQAEFLKKRFCSTEPLISTGDWLFQTTEYSKFIDLSCASVLRIKGPSRCGKSVLLSATVERLRNTPRSGNGSPHVLFCYNRNGFERVSPTTLARVLLAQTLQWKNDQILKDLHIFYSKYHILQENDKKVEKELWRLFRTVLAFEPGKISIVLDGLDECASPLICVQYLMKVVAETKSGILLSSRRDGREIFNNKTVQSTLKKHDIPLLQLEMTKERIYPDLMAYVAYQVNNHDSFSAKSQEIRDKFINGVCHRADGMFLYANLVFKDLRRDKLSSARAIDATLADLPTGLLEIYRDHCELPRRTLKGPETFCWIYCASSPLSWHELQSALAIGDSGYDEDEIVDDSCEAFIEYSCGQLIESYGESDRLRFIHPTVKDFLDEKDGPGSSLGIPKAHSMVASKLLIFLEYPDLPFFSSPEIDDNFEAVIKTYTSQCGRGLYAYATYNWYVHLKECDKSEDGKLEQQVLRYIMSPAIIRWLKSAIIISHATGYGPADSVSLTVDVIHSLQTWMLGRTWSDPQSADVVQSWIKDFVDLMLDWGKVLETQSDWIHYIHHQLLPENSCFRRILENDGDESVVQFRPTRVLTKSSQTATWPDCCFVTDLKRDLAFVYQERFISCYHMRTGLLTAEIAIPFSRYRGSLVLRRGVLCPQGKYLATIFEVKSSWSNPVKAAIRSGLQLVPEENCFSLNLEDPAKSSLDTCIAYMAFGVEEVEFVVCLLQLNHKGPARSEFFGLPNWAANPILVTGKQSLRWELDDIDALTFSSNSSRLVTPFGIFDLESGEKMDPWSFALTLFSKGGKITENIDIFMTIIQDISESQNGAIGFRGIDWQTEAGASFPEVNLPGIGHLLASSNRGRFVLVLRVQTAAASKSSRSKSPNGQQGSIEIWDRSEKKWTLLLLLDPASSGSRAPWDLSPFAFPPRFSPEANGPDEVNRVLVYVPAKWKLSGNVRNRNGFDSRQAQLLLFEARKTGNSEEGFGPYPTLRYQLPAAAFRRENTTSDLKLTILAWSPQLESAIVYSSQHVKSMTQDEMRKAALEFLQYSQSKKKAANHKDNHVKEYSTSLFSTDNSASFHIRIRVDSLVGNDNVLPSINNQLLTNEGDILKYEIFVACLRTGETEPELSSVQHLRVSAISYPPLNSQYLNSIDEENITIGCLELNLHHDFDGMVIEVKSPDETVFHQALQCFKRKAQPLKRLSYSSESAVVRKGSEITYTIFSQSEIAFRQDGAIPIELNSGKFLARTSITTQQSLHIFEFSRPIDHEVQSDGIHLEARQFEVYLCIFDESHDAIPWLMHSITAGETGKSTGIAPETAWVLHPQLPLLVWLLPGHRLRLSNIQSNEPPITIAESLVIEDNSTQPMLFSPNGRYLALKAQESFKYAWTYNLSQSIGSVILCDLVEGKTVIATPTAPTNVTIDIDDEFLHVYNLTREGGIQSSSYQLPSLELKQRQYLTFIPTNCCCSTCGKPIQENPNISIIEHQGLRLVTLGHCPIKIGAATVEINACEPLMLRITSPPVDLNLSTAHDAYLTVASTKIFPKIIDEKGEILVDAFTPSHQTCSKPLNIECSCLACRADILPITVPGNRVVPQMQSIIRDLELTTGGRITRDEIEEHLKRSEKIKAKDSAVKEKEIFSVEDAKRIFGEEIFPWDSWIEFSESMEEIKDEFDHEAHVEKFYDPENRGVGCRIPLLVQTFSFRRESEAELGFEWSSAIGVGWIEEDIRLFYRQMFSGSMAGSRRWYPFPAFESLAPRAEELIKDQSSKGKRFRRLFGKKANSDGTGLNLEAPQNASSVENDIKKGEQSVVRLPKTKEIKKPKFKVPNIGLDGEDIWEPLFPITDVLDSLSDLVPGMGDIFKHRIKSVMMQDLITRVPE